MLLNPFRASLAVLLAAPRVTSYLAVGSITSRRVCVTHRIPPSATANEQARRAADRSASAPCLRER